MKQSPLTPYTPKEAAEILGRNIKSVYEAMHQGQIPSMRVGKLFLIPRPAFDAMLRGGKIGGDEAACEGGQRP
jgi:excisionase family DNA binding protein